VSMRCSVMQCAAVCCSVLQYVAAARHISYLGISCEYACLCIWVSVCVCVCVCVYLCVYEYMRVM